MKNYKVIVAVVFVYFAMACSKKVVPVIPVPTTPPVVNATFSEADLAQGKQLYENNCAKCHKLYAPDSYDKANWETIVNRMARKAKITDAEKSLVFHYLTNGK
jgi:cytochrome c5